MAPVGGLATLQGLCQQNWVNVLQNYQSDLSQSRGCEYECEGLHVRFAAWEGEAKAVLSTCVSGHELYILVTWEGEAKAVLCTVSTGV